MKQCQRLYLACTLSKAPLNCKKSEIGSVEITSHIHLIELNYLISLIWSKSKNDIPTLIWSHFIHQQDLAYSSGTAFKVICRIVRKSLCEDMKHLLYVVHLGIVKIKGKAHDKCWPDINADLENIVNTCDTCQE